MAKRIKIEDGIASLNRLKDAISDNLIKDVNKDLGNIAYSLGETESPNNIKDFISSGSTLLDTIMTNGQVHPKNGYPIGRLVLLSGDTSSGKSLLATHALINTQKAGGIPIIFDEESTIDLALLKRMGLKIGEDALNSGFEKPVYLQAGTVEKVLEAMEKIILKIRETNSQKLITIVWDSIASTPTNKELEGSFEKEGYGTDKALALSLATRKLTQMVASHNVLLLWTNQVRMNIGAMGWGDKTTMPGGKAVPFHATIHVRLAKVGDVKNDNKETIGVTVKATTKKNKIAPYNRTCEFNIYFNKGIDDVESWRDNLVDKKIIKRPTSQKYVLIIDEKEYEFKKADWYNVVLENNLYDKIKEMVVKANTIDYESFIPSFDDLVNSAKNLAEIDEENEASED